METLKAKTRVGITSIEDNKWVVYEDGNRMEVFLGEVDTHPILHRGKHEESPVTFMVIQGKAAIICTGTL